MTNITILILIAILIIIAFNIGWHNGFSAAKKLWHDPEDGY